MQYSLCNLKLFKVLIHESGDDLKSILINNRYVIAIFQ